MTKVLFALILTFVACCIGVVAGILFDINNNNDTMAVTIAAASALFSAIGSTVALYQVIELRNQKVESERPYVIVYFEGKGNQVIYVIIENLGATPARNIKVQFNPSPIYRGEKPLNDISLFSTPISILLPRKRYEQIIDSGPVFFAHGNARKFNIHISYSSVNGKNFTEIDDVDLTYLVDATVPIKTSDESLVDISKHLESLNNRLGKITDNNSLKVETVEQSRIRLEKENQEFMLRGSTSNTNNKLDATDAP